MPTPTDLVTDLPADFEVFGQAVDTSLADLRGGTTGQILSKTTNADMDFTWTSANPGDITGVTAGTGISGGGTSGAVTITNDMATTITASGDIVIGTGSGTYDNLPIGTTGQILTADTTVSPYKVKWAAPASASFVGVRVQQAAASQSIPNATDTVITWTGTENFDTDGFHSGVTNTGRLTVPAGKAGYYKIYGICNFVPNATGRRAWGLSINATTPIVGNELPPSSVAYLAGFVNTTYYLNDGDFVTMGVYQESGGSLNIDSNVYSFFGMEKIG